MAAVRERYSAGEKPIKIGIVGKYFGTGEFVLADSYVSVIEAVKHAAYYFNRKPVIEWLNAESYETKPHKLQELSEFDGVIVPGGFGGRGVEGKIAVINYCRRNKIPFGTMLWNAVGGCGICSQCRRA